MKLLRLIFGTAGSFLLMCGTILSQVNGNAALQTPLSPKNVPQFVDPLPHFAGQRVDKTAGGSFGVSMEPTAQQALSTGTVLVGGTVGVTPGVGLTNLWAYKVGGVGPYWPAFTIEAFRGHPLTITYQNNLGGQTYEGLKLTADQTLHWANPDGGPMTDLNPYAGEIPAVVHLHGGEVPSEFDGGPDSWFTPSGNTGPAWANPRVSNVYTYSNSQEEATIWFHDHALGVTRLNVYAGMAGFYFLRGPQEEALKLPGWSGDNTVTEVQPAGTTPVFRGEPYLPEIEIAIQGRMFDTEGQLFFPAAGLNPEHPFWVPEFLGDIITVNGRTWPYLSVAPRRYRFRILNGSNARFYELWLKENGGGPYCPVMYQIGTDGGLLNEPVAFNSAQGEKLLLAPGERADVIIDFSGARQGQKLTLRNSAKSPYPNGTRAVAATQGRIMQFVVNGIANGPDKSFDPRVAGPFSLRPAPGLVALSDFRRARPAPGVTVANTRQLTLNEVMGPGGPLEVLVNNSKWFGRRMDGTPIPGAILDGQGNYVTETPTEGSTEVWQIINLTADAHPIHLHLVQFQLVSRQQFRMNKYIKAYDAAYVAAGVSSMGDGPPNPYGILNADGALGGNPAITPFLQGPVNRANPNERGWKDTFVMYPGEVTTVIARWAPTDKPVGAPASELLFGFDPSVGPGYVWHCHIIDHEDNEMMRPYAVNPSPVRTAALATSGSASSAEDADATIEAPVAFALDQNYPNPFNPRTQIRFGLPEDSHIRLVLYNELGQEVQTLIDAEAKAGNHTVELNGASLASGMYFYRLTAGNNVAMKKMVLIK